MEKFVTCGYDTTMASIYKEEPEIAIIGASRAHHHYVPQIISDSLNASCYNFGVDGENIFFQYALLNSFLSHSQHNPKLILLELSAIDVNNTPKWNTEKLTLLYPYFYSENSVKNLLKDVLDSKEYMLLKISGFYRHNSRFLTYFKNLIKKEVTSEPKLNGYEPLKGEWKKELSFEKEQGDVIDSLKMKYVISFINLCKKRNISLVFAISPRYDIRTNEIWKGEIVNICNRYQIPLLDYEQDDYYKSHRDLFKEPIHLNDKGAKYYTKTIAHELKRMFQY